MNSDFYIFRKGRRVVSGNRLLRDLRESLNKAIDEESWVAALLRAGELECALADRGSQHEASVALVTDQCAATSVGGNFGRKSDGLYRLPEQVPENLEVSSPEGFAYYALHPLRYAAVAAHFGEFHDAVVVGIRSVGTTLSAVTAAAMRKQGARSDRFTVRPKGHPFDRVVEWDRSQMLKIQTGVAKDATFLVVDEGPGLSGSSFLSVGEGLLAAGVPENRIALIPGYAPNPENLRARDAVQRWTKFRFIPVGAEEYLPGGASDWIGAGEWRRRFLTNEKEWPGTWTSMERSKFVSTDGRVIWKFEGLGQYGEPALRQAYSLAEAGFGSKVVGHKRGFTGYELLRGRMAQRKDLNPERLQWVAAYCAFRAANFGTQVTSAQQQDLETMLRVNYEREFGAERPDRFKALDVVTPIICDAKMLPHEWFLEDDGRFVKLDATSHGDGHFFPGPCDVAWDLAGAIVEWEMDGSAREALLRGYCDISGDDASARIEGYMFAYAVFRYAWSRMAAAGMKNSPEEERLLRDYRKYRAYVERLVAETRQASTPLCA